MTIRFRSSHRPPVSGIPQAVRSNGFDRVAGLGFGLVVGLGIVLGITAGMADPAWSDASEIVAPPVAGPNAGAAQMEPAYVWQTLHYRGTNWLARFSVELEIHLPEPGRPSGLDADWVAELRTSLSSVFLREKSTWLRAHFDPITAAVRRLTQLSTGPRPDFKSYEFQPGGATRIRSEPAEGQSFRSPEGWPEGRRTAYPYDSEALGCRVISNPAALAWWITSGPTAAKLRIRDLDACYFLGKTLYKVSFEALGTSTAGVDYQRVRKNRSSRRSGQVPVERYRVTSRPIAGKLDEKTMVAEIVLDAENQLPLRFVTREGLLKIDVKLHRVVLRETAQPTDGSRAVASRSSRPGSRITEIGQQGLLDVCVDP